MKKHFLRKLFSSRFGQRTTLLALAGLAYAFSAGAQTTVTGIITDQSGTPIAGATVVVKNSSIGTLADMEGGYTINVPDPTSVLQFSFLGYLTKEETVGTRTTINVTLEEDSKQLEEVVVVGYGTMKKKDLTGAVASINADKYAKEQPATIQDLMRTNVPGLSASYTGDAKGNASIAVRGKNNFRVASTENNKEYDPTAPLLVLDGAVYFGQLTDINPNDVERIDVLKDASSAAVFGAQAANGVILITTKKGKTGKPVIRFGTTIGWGFTNGVPKNYGPNEYVGYRRDVMMSRTPREGGFYDDPSGLSGNELTDWLALDGATSDPQQVWLTRLGFSENERKNIIDKNYINWKDLIYRTSFRQDYNVSVSGMVNQTSYYTSVNYTRNLGNVGGNEFESIRARVNLESRINKVVSYGLNAQFTKRDEGSLQYTASGLYSSSPYGDLYDENGEMLVYPMGNLNSYNPLIDRLYTDRINDFENINASMFLNFDLGWGFFIKTTYTPRYEWRTWMRHKSTEHPLWASPNDGDTAERRHYKTLHWNWDNVLGWKKEFRKHAFDFTFLANWEKRQFWYSRLRNKDFEPSDVLGYHGIEWGTAPLVNSQDTQETADALMARLHYSYDNKYMVTATYRRDGYSEFGRMNPHAGFISAGLGWVFTNEDFFPETSWLDYGKFRFSYGENGNRDLAGEQYVAFLLFQPMKYLFKNSSSGEIINTNAYFASQMGNPYLQWESTTSYNIGLDFTLLKSRLTGSIDIYHKATNNLLTKQELPNLTGYQTVWSNIGEVQNRGIELMLTSNNIRRGELSWSTTFTMTYNKSRINDLYGLYDEVKDADGNVISRKKKDDLDNERFIGKPYDAIWGYEFIGVWQEDETDIAALYGQKPGDPKILDVDGNFSYDNDDKVFQGNETPRYRLSLRNDVSYKNWTFSINMYANLKYKLRYNRAKHDSALNNTVNQLKAKYWTPENPTNSATRLGSTPPGGVTYNIWRDASFMRIENISVGYSLPSQWCEKMKVASMNVNLSLKNVAVLTRWPGEDPENNVIKTTTITPTNVGNVTPRLLYLGLNVTF